MKCPKCGRILNPTTRRCAHCAPTGAARPAATPARPATGRPTASRPAPPPKPAPEGDEIGFRDPEPPPAQPAAAVRGARMAAPMPARRRRFMSGGGGAAKATLGGIGSILLICAFIGLRVCRVVNRVTGKTVVDETVTVDPDDSYGGVIEVQGSHTYTFTVTALDGDLKMSVGRVSRADQPTEAEILGLAAAAKSVAKGRTETMTGTLGSGNYLWFVVNEDEKKPARAKIKFHGR